MLGEKFIYMAIKNKWTGIRGGGGEGQWGKDGEGSSQGTCIKDPWTKATDSGVRGGLTMIEQQ